MSDSRTPEQRKADDALTEAIQGACLAYGSKPDAAMTEYVVVASHQWWDDDGDLVVGITGLPRDGDVPLHRLLGLLEYACARTRKAITTDEGE